MTAENAMQVIRPSRLSTRFLSPKLLCVTVAFAVITAILVSERYELVKFSQPPSPLRKKKVTCIEGPPALHSREGLGAFIRRNQIAFFLAASNNVPISFKTPKSSHGYTVENFFDKCQGAEEVRSECLLKSEMFLIKQCPRAACECFRKDMDRLMGEAERNCQVIKTSFSNQHHNEYSGCIRSTLNRYFGNDTRPSFEYDAVHYRQGDVKGSNKTIVWSERELYYIMSAMCRLSSRPIVIVTEGNPMIPNCGRNGKDRRILASDLSIRESFRIFQYAKNVAVGRSSFALAMMELATPERVVLIDNAAKFYTWVDCENWTICANGNVLYNFDSKELMIKSVLQDQDLLARSFQDGIQNESNIFPPAWYKTSVLRTKWDDDGM